MLTDAPFNNAPFTIATTTEIIPGNFVVVTLDVIIIFV
mgnify:FL=1